MSPGRSTAGVTGTLRQVLSKASEWGVGAFVASADVDGAFDGIWHEDVAQALLQKCVHPGKSARSNVNPLISRAE